LILWVAKTYATRGWRAAGRGAGRRSRGVAEILHQGQGHAEQPPEEDHDREHPGEQGGGRLRGAACRGLPDPAADVAEDEDEQHGLDDGAGEEVGGLPAQHGQVAGEQRAERGQGRGGRR
jgi:hypothetical protein